MITEQFLSYNIAINMAPGINKMVFMLVHKWTLIPVHFCSPDDTYERMNYV